jgi:hypothetical protein
MTHQITMRGETHTKIQNAKAHKNTQKRKKSSLNIISGTNDP